MRECVQIIQDVQQVNADKTHDFNSKIEGDSNILLTFTRVKGLFWDDIHRLPSEECFFTPQTTYLGWKQSLTLIGIQINIIVYYCPWLIVVTKVGLRVSMSKRFLENPSGKISGMLLFNRTDPDL